MNPLLLPPCLRDVQCVFLSLSSFVLTGEQQQNLSWKSSRSYSAFTKQLKGRDWDIDPQVVCSLLRPEDAFLCYLVHPAISWLMCFPWISRNLFSLQGNWHGLSPWELTSLFFFLLPFAWCKSKMRPLFCYIYYKSRKTGCFAFPVLSDLISPMPCAWSSTANWQGLGGSVPAMV